MKRLLELIMVLVLCAGCGSTESVHVPETSQSEAEVHNEYVELDYDTDKQDQPAEETLPTASEPSAVADPETETSVSDVAVPKSDHPSPTIPEPTLVAAEPSSVPVENTTVRYDVYIANVPYTAYLRAEPHEEGEILAEVPVRTAVGFIEVSNSTFTKVRYDGICGYVKSEYLSETLSEAYEIWTIRKYNTGIFEPYREITYTLEWEPGIVHALLSKWDVSDASYMMIVNYDVDFSARTIDLCMDHFEGDTGYTKLVVDLGSNTSYLTDLYDSTTASFISP